jgi:hypothetical protein
MGTIPHGSTRLLVKLPQTIAPSPLLSELLTPITPPASAFEHRTVGAPVAGHQWHLVRSATVRQHPWDVAHAFSRAAAGHGEGVYVEPDFLQSLEVRVPGNLADRTMDLDGNWPPSDAATPLDWHLDDQHSQLRTARNSVGDLAVPRRVRIGHLDTGYSNHETRPSTCSRNLVTTL